MIDRQQLLNDLKPLLRQAESDLRARCDEVAEIGAGLKKEYDEARDAGRTGAALEEWRADLITQVAAAWVLSCVFVRFLEDNALISPPRISGLLHGASQDGGLERARDERETYFRSHPRDTDRDYLLAVFDDLARLPGAKDVFGPHNPVVGYRDWLSGDAAQRLIEFFQRIDTDGSGEIIHDFTDSAWDTRFLGDLYQDLSEAARKKYALLQTPIFVEEFILERTLEPAIEEFAPKGNGLENVRMIDPACGSGHFLLGAFARILKHWHVKEPGRSDRELVNRSLASVHGVDLNPYAVAIARFRLLLVAMRECQIKRLVDSPDFKFNLACGDSLLHGEDARAGFGWHKFDQVYQAEDAQLLGRILRPGHYHAVVANPPYITPKDPALNAAYRERYSTCHRQYSLAVPFMQRLFQLAFDGYRDPERRGGFVGQITANSFMKREFGKKLIEKYFAGGDGAPSLDLTHVIDTSGAYIPGHGTPTVILFGRNRAAVGSTVRTAMGIRGEPSTPEDPARGLVWSAIIDQLHRPGSQSQFISVADSPRQAFLKHPWSIGGGGAAELKETLDDIASACIGDVVEEIGFGAVTRDDDVFLTGGRTAARWGIHPRFIKRFITGENVRDWGVFEAEYALWPYEENTLDALVSDAIRRRLWLFRTQLCIRSAYGKTQLEHGLEWFEYSMFFKERFRARWLLSFAAVATANHFCIRSHGDLFNRHAPVVKLHANASEDDHLALLGLLNSSTACFWMKQVFHDKGSTVDSHGARQTTVAFENFREFTATGLQKFPVPADRPLDLARQLDKMAQFLSELSPDIILRGSSAERSREALAERHFQWEGIRQQMISLQEELDWQCYALYGIVDEDLTCHETPPALELGQRAFEIRLARWVVAGSGETTWFERHGSTPITDLPAHWPADYRRLVERRLEVMEENRNIALIEQPEYKRRWNTEPWDSQLERALRSWLLDRLESYFDFDGRMSDQRSAVSQKKADCRMLIADSSLTTVAQVADLARSDGDFMQVAEIFTGRMDFDVAALVGKLIAAESVPALPVLRYKPAGLDKRRAWERTWQLQREEDKVTDQRSAVSGQQSAVSQKKADSRMLIAESSFSIPVPPKYTSADFRSSDFWRLRGKLDVPKERWVGFPHCEGEDGTLVIAWAGYDHLQLARAIAERYELSKEQEGRKLEPLLAAIGELVPWLKQWHNELDPAYGTRMGDYFEGYLAEEAKTLGKSVEEVMNWTPPEKAGKKKKSRTSK